MPPTSGQPHSSLGAQRHQPCQAAPASSRFPVWLLELGSTAVLILQSDLLRGLMGERKAEAAAAAAFLRLSASPMSVIPFSHEHHLATLLPHTQLSNFPFNFLPSAQLAWQSQPITPADPHTLFCLGLLQMATSFPHVTAPNSAAKSLALLSSWKCYWNKVTLVKVVIPDSLEGSSPLSGTRVMTEEMGAKMGC